MSHSFHNKAFHNTVVRPGSMNYNHSYRVHQAVTPPAKQLHHSQNGRLKAIIGLLLVLVIGAGSTVAYATLHDQTQKTATISSQTTPVGGTGQTTTPATVNSSTAINNCAANTLEQNVVVSISQRHLWACGGSTSRYDSPVITGIAYLPADKTPLGIYHVYGKVTNTVLSGSDSTGAWRDPVSYWMPFLDNQYGAYGFHDATWRPDSAFGTIDPNSSQGSHGCVELPLATAKWLYGWVQIGTTVTVES